MEDILCTGCDYAVGQLVSLHDELSSIIKEQYKSTMANRFNIENFAQEPGYKLGPLFDILYLKCLCCRKMMLTKVRADDLAGSNVDDTNRLSENFNQKARLTKDDTDTDDDDTEEEKPKTTKKQKGKK